MSGLKLINETDLRMQFKFNTGKSCFVDGEFVNKSEYIKWLETELLSYQNSNHVANFVNDSFSKEVPSGLITFKD